MGTLFTALLEKTGVSRFFRGVSVELPAYFLPNFQVLEIHNAQRAPRIASPKAPK
jgi:hypothetical protein